jgi:hypothetical protein
MDSLIPAALPVSAHKSASKTAPQRQNPVSKWDLVKHLELVTGVKAFAAASKVNSKYEMQKRHETLHPQRLQQAKANNRFTDDDI